MKAGIAGAGLLGRMLALELIRNGWTVTLYDADNIDGHLSCGMAAAGMLAPLTELVHSDALIYELGLKSLALWPQWMAQLNDSENFHQLGSIVTAHPNDHSDLERTISFINQKLPAGENSCHLLTKEKLFELEPELNKFPTHYYFPQEGHIDNQHFMQALAHKLLNSNTAWHIHTPVVDLKPGKIILNNSTATFDCVFDCRGLGAKSSWPHLRGVRGELLWLHAPDVCIKRPVRLIHPRYSLYIVPRPEKIYLIGSTEIEAEDLSPISVRSSLELLSAAFSLHSGFIEARVIKSVVNCRPALLNNLPKINCYDGLIAINGLYRHGFLVAPALIHEVLRCLQDKPTTPFSSMLVERKYAHSYTE